MHQVSAVHALETFELRLRAVQLQLRQEGSTAATTDTTRFLRVRETRRKKNGTPFLTENSLKTPTILSISVATCFFFFRFFFFLNQRGQHPESVARETPQSCEIFCCFSHDLFM